MDSALKASVATANLNQQKAALKTIAEQYNKDLPYLLEWRSPFKWFFQKNIKGGELFLAAATMQNIYKTKA